MLPLALSLAVLVGLALGLLGGGGSILTLPILQYVVGLEAHEAIAASLFVVGMTSLAAIIPHARAGRVHVKVGLIFGAASMVGAYSAGRFAKLIPPGILLVLFAVMMVITAVMMLRPKRADAVLESVGGIRFTPRQLTKIALEGLVVGAITGLVGAGGGFLVVPALVILGGLPMRIAVGTSLMVIAMKSFAGFAGHASAVTLDWPLMLGITAAALVGSVFGAKLAGLVDPTKLRRGFGWFVVVMGAFMLTQEVPKLLDLHWPFAVALIVAAITTVIAVGIEATLKRQRLADATAPLNSALPKGS